MDPSSFANQWNQLSSLNHQQQILTANISGDHDFQLLNITESAENISINPCIMKPMFTSLSTCSPLMEASPRIKYSQERPKKIPKTISWGSCVEQLPMNLVPKEEISIGFHSIQDQGLKSSSSQGLRPAHAHEHIIAERKRREKLSQRFIALAAVIPGLKKADKASILGDAIKYVKELEQTLKSLQDQKTKKIVESVAINKNATLSTNNNDSSTGGSSLVICSRSDEKPNQNPSGDLPPEIQIRLSEKTVLLRIHCENHKGLLLKILSELEKIPLTVTNANVMPFVGTFLDITVTAEVEEGFSMTVKDLAEKIRSIFHQLNW